MKPCQWVVVSPPLHIPGLCPGSCPSEPQDWGLLTLQTDPTCSVEWNYSSQPGFCICPFLLACFSSLWLRKSLRVVSLAFRVSSIPAVFMSHMNIMRVHSIPLSGQLNILNQHQYQPLRNPIYNQSLCRLNYCLLLFHPLSSAFHPSSSQSLQFVTPQFG